MTENTRIWNVSELKRQSGKRSITTATATRLDADQEYTHLMQAGRATDVSQPHAQSEMTEELTKLGSSEITKVDESVEVNRHQR